MLREHFNSAALLDETVVVRFYRTTLCKSRDELFVRLYVRPLHSWPVSTQTAKFMITYHCAKVRFSFQYLYISTQTTSVKPFT